MYASDTSMNGDTTRELATSISATVPDWSREAKPNRSLLASLRSYDHWRRSRNPIAFVMHKVAVLKHRFWSAVTGAEIPLGTRIGGGLMIPHPNGIVIHPDAVIGPNCLIFQQVTLGSGENGAPRSGGTWISARVRKCWAASRSAITRRWEPMRWYYRTYPHTRRPWAYRREIFMLWRDRPDATPVPRSCRYRGVANGLASAVTHQVAAQPFRRKARPVRKSL
jgi:hypothetical protein